MHRSPWMTDELDMLAALARDFFTEECLPEAPRWAAQQHVDRDTWRAAGDLGLLCTSIPEAYGGGGGTFAHEAVVLVAQARSTARSLQLGVHSTIIAHYLLAYGTEAQKQAWLPGMASGDIVAAVAMTEPGTGSDLKAVRTTATAEGEEYVVNGAKTFITNGLHADLVLVVARTGRSGRASDISLVAVEAERAGFSRGRNLHKIGQHGADTVELYFDDVRVPRTNLLGEEPGRGFAQLMAQLPQERLAIALMAVGAIAATLRVTTGYVRQREAFGQTLMDFQNTRFVLAECDTIASGAWAFVDQCVAAHVEGRLDTATAAKAKWWLTEQQCVVADRCLQLFGGYGYMAEYPIARRYADARVQKIYGGTNEIMKELTARAL